MSKKTILFLKKIYKYQVYNILNNTIQKWKLKLNNNKKLKISFILFN